MAANGLGKNFTYDVSRFAQTDPAKVRYAEAAQIRLDLTDLRGLAADLDGSVWATGAGALEKTDRDGRPVLRVELRDAGQCVAVGPDGAVYVGMRDHVELFGADGKRNVAWPALGSNAVLTSIAAGTHDVFVADAGQRVVHHFDRSGKLLGVIDGKTAPGQASHFIVPSPYFDVALGPRETLWIVNPGEQRVENFTFDGKPQSSWGKAGMGVEGFCGCCNPTHIAILADGSFITSEKGLPRVKRYAPNGELDGVIAGVEAFAEGTVGLDLAADAAGRVLVLDPKARAVRVFNERAPKSEVVR